MQLRTTALVLLAVSILATACGTDARRSPTQPTVFNSDAPISVRATSSPVSALAVNNPFCPSVAPFNVPLGIVVTSNGMSAIVVNSVRLRFTDTSGRSEAQVTLPGPVPIVQFGSALQQARDQTFGFVLGIGCATGRQGNVIIIVDGLDGFARPFTSQVLVAVR